MGFKVSTGDSSAFQSRDLEYQNGDRLCVSFFYAHERNNQCSNF